MKKKTRSKSKGKTMYEEIEAAPNSLYEKCIKKGLIEKTSYGYYFKPEFFETLALYKEE